MLAPDAQIAVPNFCNPTYRSELRPLHSKTRSDPTPLPVTMKLELDCASNRRSDLDQLKNGLT